MTAHLLHARHEVTVFEADTRVGGHAHTVPLQLDGRTVWVDTGFLVYNERNYPGFVRLLDRLGVATQPSDMSFSVSDERTGLEWRGTNLSSVFAQRRRVADPRFLRMLGRRGSLQPGGTAPARRGRRPVVHLGGPARRGSLQPVLPRVVPGSHGVGDLVGRSDHVPRLPGRGLRPLLREPRAAPRRRPAAVAHDHGRLTALRRPPSSSRSATGSGSRRRSTRSSAGATASRSRPPTGPPEHFDRVVIATHSDQALRLLSDPDAGRARDPRLDPLPAERRHAPHRLVAAAPHPQSPSGVELPPRRRGRPARAAAAGDPHLPPQHPAGARRRPATSA